METMDKRRMTLIWSNGEPSARGYAVATVRPSAPEPPSPERVVLVHPARTPTVTGSPVGAGPRNPDQKVWPPPARPAIELPDQRPLTKAQRFWIDPELIARWDREAAAGGRP
jgi:hypothetical protein